MGHDPEKQPERPPGPTPPDAAAIMTKWLRTWGATKGPATSDPRVDREEAVRLYNEGTSAQALAQHYGVTPDRVKRRLRAWDVPLRTRKQAAQHTARTRRETQARALDAYRLFP
ncbi:hypothetical protein PUR61_20115 [Streptomyces sp. BE20]|uniref:hypothetical protein n=1 Tax=Streptomyces sp. BE20 TaxID=3002525 RepID=UPI002E7815E9|nr:hypothetical protein [Streptomyces sp. BE20]MEE1824463.1 hypothetical protein [Streptomyces sp. BE20]